MTWINLKPRQQLEAIRDQYPAIYKAFELDRVLDALREETKYTIMEALCEAFKAPEPAPSDEGTKR